MKIPAIIMVLVLCAANAANAQTIPLQPPQVSLQDATHLIVGSNCSLQVPCGLRIGSLVFTYLQPAVITLNNASMPGGTLLIYGDSMGNLDVGMVNQNISIACTATCQITPVGQFPVDSIPLYMWNINPWPSTGSPAGFAYQGTDFRAVLSAEHTFIGGTCLTVTETGNTVSFADTCSPQTAPTQNFQPQLAPVAMNNTDTTLYTWTLPANSLAAGAFLTIEFAAKRTIAASGNGTMKLWIGSSSFSVLGSADNSVWEARAVWCNLPGSTQVQQLYTPAMHYNAGNSSETWVAGTINSTTIDTTQPVVIKLTQNDAAGNSWTPMQWSVK